MNNNIIKAISIISTINATISIRKIIGIPEFKYNEPLKEKSFCDIRKWWVNKFNVGYHIVNHASQL